MEQSSRALFYNGNILYVGGSGGGNYTKIQDAIDNASDGDTVFVYNGTYYEKVVVDKSINLIGEDKTSTVIDGSRVSHVVYVSAYWVNISGFTIQNSGHNWAADTGIKIYSKHITITDNTISNNKYGIYLWGSSCNTITGNNIISNNEVGIVLEGYQSYVSSSNTITSNNISNNKYGIYLWDSNGNNITSNNITLNNEDGIYLWDSNDNNITSNNITLNNEDGITLAVSDRNKITGNIIISNTWSGIDLVGYLSYVSSNNTITGNNISNNYGGICLYYDNYNGICLNYYSSNNNITGNNIISNKGFGIYLCYSSSNTITSNNIISNNKYGLILSGSNNNNILKNNFLNNKRNAHLENSKNTWNQNYWNRPRFLPKLIFGISTIEIGLWISIPLLGIEIDWHPAQEPYDIEV